MSEPYEGKETQPPLGPRVLIADDPRQPQAAVSAGPQVIATEQAGRIVPRAVSKVTLMASARMRTSFTRKLCWFALLAAFGTWLGVDLYLWVETAFARSVGLGWVATAALATAVVAAGILVGREIRSYLALKNVESHQKLFAPSMAEHLTTTEMQKAIRDVIAGIPKNKETIAAVEAFQRQAQRHHSSSQQIELLSQTVLAPLDRRAEAIVRRSGARAFGITAISPTAITDAVFFIATSVRMVREIASCYGHRPTAFVTLHILRRLIADAGRLGAVDLAGAALTQHLGGAVAERIAAGAAESVYATQRMARLGLVTMGLCRPVPFSASQVPSIMASLVGNLFSRR